MRFAWMLAAMAALWVQPAGAVTIVASFDFENPIGYDFESNGITIRANDVSNGSVSAFYNMFFPLDPGLGAVKFEFDADTATGWDGSTGELGDPTSFIEGMFQAGHNVIIPSAPLRYFYFGTFGIARIDNLTITIEDVPGGVPEPGAWALMILGIGMAGAMIRRRHAAGAAHVISVGSGML